MHLRMKKWSVHLVISELYVGELEPEVARDSMFNPEKQRLEVLEYTEDAINLLYQLMGEEVEPRKKFIIENIDFSEIKE